VPEERKLEHDAELVRTTMFGDAVIVVFGVPRGAQRV
jgi:hypothetical protein